MSLLYIINGDYGQVIELTMVDVDTDAAADVSSYTTSQQMLFIAPDSTATTKTAAFKTDGTDGIIKYTTESGFLTTGDWEVRARVSSGTAVLTSIRHKFTVLS